MTNYESTKVREALGECTVEWTKDAPSPIDAVLTFRKKLGSSANHYSTYLSTAITAGGYVRDASLSTREVPRKNSETALLYADHLARHGLVDLEQSVDAVALGHIPDWKQSDYLRFWLPILTRPKLTIGNIRHLNKVMDNFESTHDIDIFNNSHAPHALRRPIYQSFGNTYLNAISGMQNHPIHQTIQLVDGELSLGGDVEALVSQASNIEVLVPSFNGSESEFIESIDDQPLRRHLAELAELGASFVHHSSQPGISLQPLENHS